MTTLTEADRYKVLETLSRMKGSVEKTASRLGLTRRQVEEIDIIENRKFNYTREGRGRPELQKYIVAIRDVDHTSAWDLKDTKIAQARDLYDQGLVEITTGRDGFNLILYAIPRHKPAIRKPYFVTEEAPLNPSLKAN